MASNQFTVSAVFRGVDRISAPITRMQSKVGQFTRSAESGARKLDRMFGKIGGTIKRVGLAAGAALAVTAAAAANVVNTGADFERTLVSAAVKAPGALEMLSTQAIQTTDHFKALKETAREVGRTTEFSASQAADGLNFLLMAGFNVEQSIAALPSTVDLATAANLDLGRATDIATDALGAYNLMVDDAAQRQKNLTKVSDLLLLGSIRANTTIEDLFEAVKVGAPIARATGQSIELITATIAKMADAGFKGSEAGTAFRNIILAFLNPAGEAAQIFKQLDVEVKDLATGKMKDVDKLFKEIGESIETMDDFEQGVIFNKLFGKRPIAGAISIKNAVEGIGELAKDMIEITGVAPAMAGAMRNTVGGSIDSLKSSIESVKISIFDLQSGSLKNMIDRMTEWVRKNEDYIALEVDAYIMDIVNNKDEIFATAKNLGKLAIMIGAVVLALKAFILVMTVVNLVMAANPVVLITIAIIALIAAIVLVVTKWKLVEGFFERIPLWVKFFFPIIGMLEILGRSANWLIENWEPVKAFFKNLADDLKAFLNIIPDWMIGNGIAGNKQMGKTFAPGFEPGSALAVAPNRLTVFDAVKPHFGIAPQSNPANAFQHTVSESRNVQKSEVTIRTERGTSAEFTGPQLPGVKLGTSGAF